MPEHPAIKRGWLTFSEAVEQERGGPPSPCPECGGHRIWIVSLITSRLNPDGKFDTTGGHIVASCDKCHTQEATP